MNVRAGELSGLRRRLEALAISLAGGGILLLASRYAAWGPLLGLGMAVLLLPAITERWRAPITGYMPGMLLFMLIGHSPLRSYGMVAALVLPTLLVWTYFVQALLAAGLRRTTKLPAWILLPIAVGAGEWLRPWLSLGDFNMHSVGGYLFNWPLLIQFADTVGQLGLSALAMVVWGALAEPLRRFIDDGERPNWASTRNSLAAAAAVLVLLVAYGGFRLATLEQHPGPKVAIIQPSLDHELHLTPKVVDQQRDMTLNWVPPGSVDLIVWPEYAILVPDYDKEEGYQDLLRWLTRVQRAPLVAGVQTGDPIEHARPSNTVVVMGVEGEELGRYNKVVLFPFTERKMFPFLETAWPWLSKKLDDVIRGAWGHAPNGWAASAPLPFDVELGGESYRIWTPICYETSYSYLGRSARRQGANLIINLTSEGWLGYPATHHMLGASVMRAVENRVGLIRAANTGVSCLIGPDGRVLHTLRGVRTGRALLEEGFLIEHAMVADRGPTVYSRVGTWLDALPFVAWLVLIVMGVLRRRRAREA